MPEKYSSIKEGKSRPMPEAMDGKHSKEILEADTPEQKEALEDIKEIDDKIAAREKATPPEPVKDLPVVEKEETIEVPKSEFEELKKSVEEMKTHGEFLETISDKKAKALYYQRHKDELPTHVKLSTWNTKDGPQVVVQWRMIVDQGEFRDPLTGRRIEKQEIEIILENGEKVQLPYAIWVEQYGHIECEQVGTETDEAGRMKLKLKNLDTGKEYVVGAEYVN